MQVYGEVAKMVGPKRAKLKAAQDNLAKKQAQLATAQAKLAEVLAAVQALKSQYDESTANKKALEEELADLQSKLERAEKLVTGLAGEKARWEASIADLEARIDRLPVRLLPLLRLQSFTAASCVRRQSCGRAQLLQPVQSGSRGRCNAAGGVSVLRLSRSSWRSSSNKLAGKCVHVPCTRGEEE